MSWPTSCRREAPLPKGPFQMVILSANDQVLESMSLWGDISRLSLSTADYASLEGEGARWGKSTHTTSFNED